MRHTTFRFALAPTPAQAEVLARHAGASRFAYNQSLRLVDDALAARRTDPQARVPWSGFDLINSFNTWKKTEAAGRVFVVAPDGTITKQVTGLGWRHEVSAQVFEEAAVDLGRALAAYARANDGKRRGPRVGFPQRKRKGRCRDSFRLRNKKRRGGTSSIRVGDGHPRSVTLPMIGTVRVHDDTRRLRRLLRPVAHLDPETGQQVLAPRGKVLFVTCRRHGTRWYVSLNVEAPDLHPQRRHRPRGDRDHGGWVGLDRGLAAFVVTATADGAEVGRWQAPRPLQRDLVGCGDGRGRWLAPSPAPAVGPGRSGGCRGVTPASPIPVTAFCTRSPPGSSRPTTGCAWKTSPSPTSSATTTSPAGAATPGGPNSPASSATRPDGSAPSWWSVTAGSHPPRPAHGAKRSSGRYGWTNGCFTAAAAA
jgi:transposase